MRSLKNCRQVLYELNEKYDVIYIDFDFTLFRGDSEMFTLHLLTYSNLLVNRVQLKRMQKIFLRDSKYRAKFLEENMVHAQPLSFTEDLFDKNLLEFVRMSPKCVILSLGVEAVIKYYARQMSITNAVIGRTSIKDVDKAVYASPNAAIISDSESDFRGKWGQTILYV